MGCDMVKCIDCGFLATRDYVTRELAEVDSDFRRSGGPTEMPGSPRHWQDRAPICFVQSVDLQAEVLGDLEPDYPAGSRSRSQIFDGAPADVILELFGRERPECEEAFTTWQQGFSPKEHREMLDQKRVLKREDARREEDRRWRADMRKEERAWRILKLVVFGVVVSAATLIAGAIGRGWEPGWWPL